MTVCGKYAPTSVTPSTSTRNSVSSYTVADDCAASASRAAPLRAAFARSAGSCSRTIAAHDPDGVTT